MPKSPPPRDQRQVLQEAYDGEDYRLTPRHMQRLTKKECPPKLYRRRQTSQGNNSQKP